MRLPDPSPVLGTNRAPMGPEILSNTGAGVWRKAPMAFSDSGSVLDTVCSLIHIIGKLIRNNKFMAHTSFHGQIYSIFGISSFIVKNAPILQPTDCGCKFVFLCSSSSLLLPFSALFFFLLRFYQSQSLKIAHQLRCAALLCNVTIEAQMVKERKDRVGCTLSSERRVSCLL